MEAAHSLEAQICKLDGRIDAIVEQIPACTDRDALADLREEKRQLHEEKRLLLELLREKEKLLLEEKKSLRILHEKELALLRNGAAAGPGPGSTAAEVAELHRKVSKMESVLPFLVSKVLMWRDGSTATHSKSAKDRKTSELKSQLQCAGVKGCQLLGEGIPPNCVSLAHLCKLSWADGTCHLLGLSKEDVSSPRNALLLSKPIERAYDNLAVCFYEDPADKKLKLHILWDELKSQKLADCQWLGGPKGKGYAELTNAFGDTTYGDLEAQPLQYYSSTVVPFRRVLSAHAQLSLNLAQRDGKMAGSWTFQDYRSIENVLTWLRTAELQEPPIAGSVSELAEVMSMSSAPAAL